MIIGPDSEKCCPLRVTESGKRINCFVATGPPPASPSPVNVCCPDVPAGRQVVGKAAIRRGNRNVSAIGPLSIKRCNWRRPESRAIQVRVVGQDAAAGRNVNADVANRLVDVVDGDRSRPQ